MPPVELQCISGNSLDDMKLRKKQGFSEEILLKCHHYGTVVNENPDSVCSELHSVFN